MFFGHPLRIRFGLQAIASLLLVIGLSFAPIAQANSPAPPNLTWLEFEGLPGRVEAVQVVVCDTATCEPGTLQLDSGPCTVAGCLELPAEPPQPFKCDDDTCLIVGGWIPYELDRTAWFRLLVQSQDRLWESNIAEAPLMDVGDHYRFVVSVVDEALVIQPPESAYRQGKGSLFLQGLLLTLGIEAGIVALVLWRLGLWSSLWRRTLVSFGLMHLVTYPMVWTLIMGLQPFSFAADRVFAQIWVAIALLYGLFFYFLRQARSRRLILGAVFILPALFFPSLIVLFLFSYGRSTPLTTGLSYGVALAIAEVAVTVYEAIFLAMLSRGKLSLRTTSLLSVLMNGASWAVGRWVFQ